MVFVKRLKSKIPYNMAMLKKDATTVLRTLGYKDFDLGILLTNNDTIQEYNKEYRKKDKPTDVLSFPFYEGLVPGEKIEPCCEDEMILGDLVISLEYVKEDAAKWDETFEQRMQTLLIHGICHLLGYDHEKDEEYEVMHAEEVRLLKVLGRET